MYTILRLQTGSWEKNLWEPSSHLSIVHVAVNIANSKCSLMSKKQTTGSCINYAADIGPAADKVLFVYPTTIKWLCNLRFQMFYIKIITCLPLKNNLCILGGTSNGPSSFFRSSSIFVSLLRLSTCALLLPSIVLTWIHMMTAIKSTKR